MTIINMVLQSAVSASALQCSSTTCGGEQVLLVLTIGGLMGMVGQGVRAVAGLKALSDAAASQNPSEQDQFRAMRLIVSLIIGGLAGIAATLAAGTSNVLAHIGDVETLLMLAAAGYAGTDFIESFLSNYLPGGKPKSPEGSGGAGGGTLSPGGGPTGPAPTGITPASAFTLTDMGRRLDVLTSAISSVTATSPFGLFTAVRQAVLSELAAFDKETDDVDDKTFSDNLNFTSAEFALYVDKVTADMGHTPYGTFTASDDFKTKHFGDTVDQFISAVVGAIASGGK